MKFKVLTEEEVLEYLKQIVDIGNVFYKETLKLYERYVEVNNPLNYDEFKIAYAFTVNSLMQKIHDVNDEVPKEFSMKQIKKYEKIEELHNNLLKNYNIIFRSTPLNFFVEILRENKEYHQDYLTSSGQYTYLGIDYDGKLITFWSVLPYAPIDFSLYYEHPVFLVGKKVPSCYPTFYTPLSRPWDHDLGDKMRRLENGKILSVQYYKYISEVEFICEKYPLEDIIGIVKSETFYNAYIKAGFKYNPGMFEIAKDQDNVFDKKSALEIEEDYDKVFNKKLKNYIQQL